jgi:hypothetical protein
MGEFHFDHFGTKVSEHHGAIWASQDPRKIEYLDTL